MGTDRGDGRRAADPGRGVEALLGVHTEGRSAGDTRCPLDPWRSEAFYSGDRSRVHRQKQLSFSVAII